MKKLMFKFLFSLSSFSGVLMFLLINRNINLPGISTPNSVRLNFDLLLIIKFSLVFLIVIFFAWLILFLGKIFLDVDGSIQKIEKVKPLEGQFLPVYIGLFVIALSFNDGVSIQALFLIFVLFILWFCFETVAYFNPFFILLGYRFYEIETEYKITTIIITKRKDIKNIKEFQKLTRLNNFTFLEYSYE